MGMDKRVKKRKNNNPKKEGEKVRKKVNLVLCISMRQAVITYVYY